MRRCLQEKDRSGADFDQRPFTILEISTIALRTAANLSHTLPLFAEYTEPEERYSRKEERCTVGKRRDVQSEEMYTVDRQKRWKLLCPIGPSANLASEI
jgi:hypothetical protein